MIGNPGKGDYRGLVMVSSNMISNCPIAPTNITNAHVIYGPDLASFWGKQSVGLPCRWWQIMWQYLARWWKGTK
jgi:hypothetical protein